MPLSRRSISPRMLASRQVLPEAACRELREQFSELASQLLAALAGVGWAGLFMNSLARMQCFAHAAQVERWCSGSCCNLQHLRSASSFSQPHFSGYYELLGTDPSHWKMLKFSLWWLVP